MITGELSDAWTGFKRFISLNERPPGGYTWSGVRLTRKQTTSRPDIVWPDMWKHVCDASKRIAKQKWIILKRKPENARQLRGIFFIEPDDEEFKHTMKKTPVESWKFRCQQQCLVKHQKIAAVKPSAILGNERPNVLVLSMPTNL